jgi:hypothetical protein
VSYKPGEEACLRSFTTSYRTMDPDTAGAMQASGSSASARLDFENASTARKPDAVSARIAELLERHLDNVIDESVSEIPVSSPPDVSNPAPDSFRLFRDSPGGALLVPAPASLLSPLPTEPPIRLADVPHSNQLAWRNTTVTKGDVIDQGKIAKRQKGRLNASKEAKCRAATKAKINASDSAESSEESEDTALERAKIASVVVSWPG